MLRSLNVSVILLPIFLCVDFNSKLEVYYSLYFKNIFPLKKMSNFTVFFQPATLVVLKYLHVEHFSKLTVVTSYLYCHVFMRISL